MKLPYSAVILAAILYDTDRKNTQHIIIKQKDIANQMHADVNTILRGIRHLEKAGIILNHKSIGDATEITLKAGVIPPKQGKATGQASSYSQKNQRTAPQMSNSSIDMAEIEKMIKNQK